jgi:general secretion pathway protein J
VSDCRRCNEVLRWRRSTAGQRGFTLVEVMVAMTILSLIMLATVTALRTFANTQQSVDRKVTRVDEIRSVSGFLRDTLQAAVVDSQRGGSLSVGPNSGVRVPAYFKGDAHSLEWNAPVMFGENYGGIFLVRVAQEDDRLVLRWQEPVSRRQDEQADWSEAPQRTLLEGLETWEVLYRPDFDQPWQGAWDEVNSPDLVRMTISAGGRYWPDLILPVQR